jgi:hypothetical protein
MLKETSLLILYNYLINKNIFKMFCGLNKNTINEIKYILEPTINLYKFNVIFLSILLLIYILIHPIINIIHFTKNLSKYNYELKNLFILIKNPFLNPKFDNAFQTYFYYLKNNNIKNESKLFWNNFFIKNKVNTPLVKGLIIDGIIITDYSKYSELLETSNKNYLANIQNIVNRHNNLYINIDNFKDCIIKPNNGTWGIGIKNFENYLSIPNKGIYLIQKKINNTNINGHFRITTYFNKKQNKYQVFFINLLIQHNTNKIASNGHNGGIDYEVKNNKLRKLDEPNYTLELKKFYSPKLLKKAIIKSLKLHSKINTIIIGWDVKITKNNYYFLEGNLAPSSLFFHDYYFLDKFNFVKNISYE